MFYVPSFQSSSRPSCNNNRRTYRPPPALSASEMTNMIFTTSSAGANDSGNQISIPRMKARKESSNAPDRSNPTNACSTNKVVTFDENSQNHPCQLLPPSDQMQDSRPSDLESEDMGCAAYDDSVALRRSTSLFGPPKRRETVCFPTDHRQLNSTASLRLLRRSISSGDRTCSSVICNSDTTEDLWQRSKQDQFANSRQRRDELRNPGYRRIVINVSGMLFETRVGVLECHPKTLLGDPYKRVRHFDRHREEYFFDRHRPTFEAIFNYYQYGGRLKRPIYVPDEIFLSELEFYEIEKEAVDDYKRDEGYVIEKVILPENKFQKQVWMLFEFPETSTAAFLIAILSVMFTVISIILLCVETLPEFSKSHCVEGAAPNFMDPFFILETVCTSWFTIEVIVRFFACPSKKDYCKDFKNAIDITAIVPYYVTLINVLISFSCEGAKSSASLAFLRVIRLIRVFKLTKHSPGLQVLVLTFRASLEGLSLFLVALIVCILVFSSTIYYVEVDEQGSQIESIPDAFWWAIITMCTVGYGDKVPKGPLGKLVGSVCAVAGVLTLAIPVPIITENFNKFYTHKNRRST